MIWYLLGLFFLELWLVIEIGALVGFWWTLFEFVATAMVGGSALRIQGIVILNQLRQAARQGLEVEVDRAQLLLYALAGMLLVIPGFFTDFVGAVLLLPPSRSVVIHWLARRTRTGQRRSGKVIRINRIWL